ncbi:unnamed protein product [Parnassius mnemosyne]|uniref:Reverse transcriptase domain-containing protein n=1 Tax=Parnassius mnemosyne TaxID=213953 RepID=A0AAV1KVL5_9NEOP
MCKWITSFLADRSIKVVVDGACSDYKPINAGVPQGSVLGPLLFILYSNDLPEYAEQNLTLFADDSTITVPCKNINTYEYDINNSLKTIMKWLSHNNLKINLSKTKVIHFSQRKHDNSKLIIQYNNYNIAEVESTRFFGLEIDEKLNWKSHIRTLCKNISKSAYALGILYSIICTDGLLTAYYVTVETYLRYGVIFWGNSCDCCLSVCSD